MIKLKRVYEPATPSDGLRVLVERLWPRGLSKQQACIDLWLKEIAPSAELRRWYSHEAAKWGEFCRRYRRQLRANEGLVQRLRAEARRGTVTFVFATSDADHSSAAALKAYLGRRKAPAGGVSW